MGTERDKMMAGKPFNAKDQEMVVLRMWARKLANEYNSTTDEDTEARRRVLWEMLGDNGKNTLINPPFHCEYGCRIFVGNNFSANFDCIFIDAGAIRIGDNCMIGPKTCIYAIEYPEDPKEREEGTVRPRNVTIGNNVWIGGGVTIMPGITIGDNAVIGVDSRVTEDVPANAVVAGNPAKVIRILEIE